MIIMLKFVLGDNCHTAVVIQFIISIYYSSEWYLKVVSREMLND